MISILNDRHEEYYCLTSDFVSFKIFPKYILSIIQEQYRNKVQNPLVLLKALELLKESYRESLASSGPEKFQ